MKHISVFNNQAVDYLQIQPQGTYVDATLGAGGHSRQILQKLAGGRLIAFDFDQAAIANFQLDVAQAGENTVSLINDNFANLQENLARLNVEKMDGILVDLGWSSDQLTHIPGLSFMNDSDALDMRLQQAGNGHTAASILAISSEKQLGAIFGTLGELSFQENRQLVNLVLQRRKLGQLQTVADLNELVAEVKSPRSHNLRARVYQALRIAVNNEIANLEQFIDQAVSALKTSGRCVIITFHSLEEKVLSAALTELLLAGKIKNIISENQQNGLGFIRPSVSELRQNIHAHSAKLWVIEKLV